MVLGQMRADAPESPRPGERFRETQVLARNRLVRVLMLAEPLFLGLMFLALGLTVARSAWVTLLAAWLGAGVLLPLLVTRMRMITVVTDDALLVRWIPFYARRVALARVESAAPIRYEPIRDAGGWGIKRSRRHGLVLNVYGHEGVRVVADGRPMLIGSQRPEELAIALLEGAVRVGATRPASSGR